jgi:hypothetical protein
MKEQIFRALDNVHKSLNGLKEDVMIRLSMAEHKVKELEKEIVKLKNGLGTNKK